MTLLEQACSQVTKSNWETVVNKVKTKIWDYCQRDITIDNIIDKRERIRVVMKIVLRTVTRTVNCKVINLCLHLSTLRLLLLLLQNNIIL